MFPKSRITVRNCITDHYKRLQVDILIRRDPRLSTFCRISVQS